MKLAAEKKAVSLHRFHILKCKEQESPSRLKGNGGEERRAVGCGSIVKERNESGPAAPPAKALREWRIADAVSTEPEDKWRTG